MPLEYGFSIMYCDSKKLLCSVEALEDKVQIACASPCLDTPKSYRNYGEFMQSMINGELSAMFSVDAKGEIEKNQLPLLSTSEETKNSHISSEEFYNLSDEEAERYYAIGATRGTNSDRKYKINIEPDIGVKVDIYSRVMNNFEVFVDYVWNNKDEI